ncbi:hypothetical protein DNFV4_00313 [Nitrospira tepida]|uniref:PilZ domain-containing protein n=1 Tax=Nitrospira tepida TaxID=2973512 RepID=A0AA86MVR9_9BACT|nr:hypothetical protein DNFV4_00313 [Nitrospira tepida]
MSKPNQDQLTELFGEPISRYRDQEALSDGAIVDISSCGVRFRCQRSSNNPQVWSLNFPHPPN